MSSIEEKSVEPSKVHETTRGRDAIPRQDKKAHGASKSRQNYELLDEKVGTLEKTMNKIVTRLEKMTHSLQTLEHHMLGEIKETKAEVEELKNDVLEHQEKNMSQEEHITAIETKVKGMFGDLKAHLSRIEARIAGGNVVYRETPRLDIPEPKSFNGKRDAKEVENFLWDLEQYFDDMGLVDEQIKVRTAARYLNDFATLWWRRKCADMKKGLCSINTFEEFKKELKHQFFPKNVIYEARKKLRELRHKGSIRDYVKEFTTLMLQIPDMTNEDMLFYFTDGLQLWARQELRCRDIKDVYEAIVVAKSLTEFQRGEHTKSKSHTKPNDFSKGGGDNSAKEYKDKKKFGKTSAKYEAYEEKKKAFVPKGGCFVCKGPHTMKECPKLGSLSAMVEQQEKLGGQASQARQMGSLELLGA